MTVTRRDPSQIDNYFNQIAREAREAAARDEWPDDLLKQFLAQCELHKAKALADIQHSSPEWHATWAAATAEADAACQAAYQRENAIEDIVRNLAPDAPEAVRLKMIMLRKYIGLCDNTYAAELVDEMLADPAAVTRVA